MSKNDHRVRIDFKGVIDPTSDTEDDADFNTLRDVIMARLAETCEGAEAESNPENGGSLEIKCTDAHYCYRNIYDLLTGSKLAKNATATLIFGNGPDAARESFTIGNAEI